MKNTKTLTSLLAALFCIASISTGWAKSTEDKVKDFIDNTSDTLKSGVDKFGEDLTAIQDYLNHYHWKGLIQDEATSDVATLKHLQLNGHPKAVVVRPGERIEGVVQCNLDRDQCSSLSVYRVVLGIQGQGPQTTIGNELGLVAGESLENFTLIAPTEPGMYQIRFRVVTSLFEGPALEAWMDENGNEPDGTTTIGVILVK